jgi:hypothetical protein
MATTEKDIKRWIKSAKKEKATHLIVVCDTWDYEDYPVTVSKKENVMDVYNEYNGKNMQKVMEVYNLKEDIEKQLKKFRSFNF